MKAILCPVCNGVGKVSVGFYNRSGDCQTWVSGTTNPEVCHSCGGKGWIEIGNLDDRLKPIKNISYSSSPGLESECPPG